MYFEVHAYNGTTRRFENLDNLCELNTFANEFGQKGFTKFVVKSFDADGYRSTLFFSTTANAHDTAERTPAIGGVDFYATKIGRKVQA